MARLAATLALLLAAVLGCGDGNNDDLDGPTPTPVCLFPAETPGVCVTPSPGPTPLCTRGKPCFADPFDEVPGRCVCVNIQVKGSNYAVPQRVCAVIHVPQQELPAPFCAE